jgi:hypothetical protein
MESDLRNRVPDLLARLGDVRPYTVGNANVTVTPTSITARTRGVTFTLTKPNTFTILNETKVFNSAEDATAAFYAAFDTYVRYDFAPAHAFL